MWFGTDGNHESCLTQRDVADEWNRRQKLARTDTSTWVYSERNELRKKESRVLLVLKTISTATGKDRLRKCGHVEQTLYNNGGRWKETDR